MMALKMEEGSHELRNVGNLWKGEEARKQTFPWSLQKELSLADT